MPPPVVGNLLCSTLLIRTFTSRMVINDSPTVPLPAPTGHTRLHPFELDRILRMSEHVVGRARNRVEAGVVGSAMVA
jgi:hypothetical protein